PLDVVMFKPLSSAYLNQILAFIERTQGLTSISKRDFFPLFLTAWEASLRNKQSSRPLRRLAYRPSILTCQPGSPAPITPYWKGCYSYTSRHQIYRSQSTARRTADLVV
ncbi:hypothetical protein T440DRAFT_410991, partial [Plenodomus tracheiphilus IPT5]